MRRRSVKFDDYLKDQLKSPKRKALFDAFDLPVHLAYAIVQARTKAGLTQEELGRRIGMKQSAIARLEAAAEINPQFQTIIKIAQALRPHFRFTIESSQLAA